MSKGLILLVEDHRDLAETVIVSLEAEGYVVDYAYDGIQGLELATQSVFDAIVLDIMLPGLDGYEVCRQLRERFGIDTPILMLTAKDEMADKLEGFERGADDYLVKPFEIRELLARVNALVNRKRGKVGAARIVREDLELDTRNRTVYRQGQEINLSPMGFEILRILLRESPNVVTRETLEQELWGDDLPDSDALRSHVYMLRKALDKPFEGESKAIISTVKGVGLKIS